MQGNISTLETIEGNLLSRGPAGQGVPTGGAEGQVLVKDSNDNYDTKWESIVRTDNNYSNEDKARLDDMKTYTISKNNNLFINQFMGVLKSYFDNRTYNNQNVFTYGHTTALDDDYVEGGNEIDCSAFVGLGLMGIDFKNSPYSSLNSNTNNDDDDGSDSSSGSSNDDTDSTESTNKELTLGNYPWALNINKIYYPKVNNNSPVRTASQMCQMMIESGWSVKYSDDFSTVKRGDIVFYAKKNDDGTWVQPNRYKHVSHVAVVSSLLDNTGDSHEIGSNYPYYHTMFEVSTFGKIVLNTCLEKRTVDSIVAICRPDFGEVTNINTGNIKEYNGTTNIDDASAEGKFYLISSNTGTLPNGVTSLLGCMLDVKRTYNKWGKLYSVVQKLYIVPTNSTPSTRKPSVYIRTNYCYRSGTYQFTNDYWSDWVEFSDIDAKGFLTNSDLANYYTKEETENVITEKDFATKSYVDGEIEDLEEDVNESIEYTQGKVDDVTEKFNRLQDEVLDTGEASNSYIHLEDSTMAEYQELSVDGVCSQETTQGYNLLENKAVSKTENGITFTINDDKSIKMNGTATANVYLYINGSTSYTETLGAGTYLLTGCDNGSSSTYQLQIHDGNTYYTNRNGATTITLSNDITYRSRIQVNNGTTLNNIIIKPQLIEGVEQKTYEPYTGGMASPNPSYPKEISVIEDSLKVTSCNKNLFDKNSPYNVNASIGGNSQKQFPAAVGGNRRTYFTKVKPNTSYTISTNTSFERLSIYYENSIINPLNYLRGNNIELDELYIRNDGVDSLTFTTKSNTKMVAIYYAFDTIAENIQIELNSTSTSFEQHLETQINANLGTEFMAKLSDTYKDTLKVEYNDEDGEYHLILNKRIKKTIINGSETWNYNSGNKYFYSNKFLDNYVTQNTDLKSNYYAGGMASNVNINNVIQTGNNYSIMISDFRFEKVSEFKAWLSSNNVEVYYPLATPYTVDLCVVDMPITYDKTTNLFTDSSLLPTINAKYYRSFEDTIRNLQVNNGTLQNELADLERRVSALETSTTSLASESEVEA